MVEGIEHVGLSVSNLEKSIDFYCKYFNFEVLRILEGNELLGKVVNMPGCFARIAHLKSGSNILELFEYQKPVGDLMPATRKQADKGFSHIGFRSTDVRTDHKNMKNDGVRFFSDPIEFRKNVWLCYFFGPDGEVIEIRESEKPLTTKD